MNGLRESVIRRASSGRRLYQQPSVRTKTIQAPRFVAVAWADAKEVRLQPAQGRWRDVEQRLFDIDIRALRPARRTTMVFGSQSPLHAHERERYSAELRLTRVGLGSLGLRGDEWWLTPVADVALFADGARQTSVFELRHGQLLEVPDEHDAGAAFAVELTDAPLDTGLGPLWRASSKGTFTFQETADGIVGVLRAEATTRHLDSLDLLRRILASPMADRIARLSVHLASVDETVDWPSFIERHRDLAKMASFEVELIDRPVRFGEEPEVSSVRPHALFPGEGWRIEPLEWRNGFWCLRRNGALLRWQEVGGTLRERLPDGTQLPTAVIWHQRLQRGPDVLARIPDDFLMLPSGSDFLSRKRLLPHGPLSRTALEVFADDLEQSGDAAAPLIQAALRGEKSGLHGLWQPFALTGGPMVRAVFEGEHLAGFFESVTIRPWYGFDADFDALVSHPMLQRLKRMDLRPPQEVPGQPQLPSDPVLSAIRRAPPGIEVLWMGEQVER